jgi:CubicO group peptidase (beta-lactamase class C family)
MIKANSNDARHLPAVKPEEAGFSSERLGRIHTVMQGYIDRNEVPCVISLVARHGKIAYFDVQGMMDIDNRIPAKEDTIFRMFSMTKPMTAAAVLMLYEEGRFQLDDPISRFLPEFANPVVYVYERTRAQRFGVPPASMTIPANREITIRDCLTHTTGLAQPNLTPVSMLNNHWEAIQRSGWKFPFKGNIEPAPTMRERVKNIAGIPLCFHPGTAWAYGMSNCVAGVLVEVISGKTLEDFFTERIFKPLGMNDSSFYLPKNKLPRFATNYVQNNEGGVWKLKVNERPETSEKVLGPRVFFSGGGYDGGVLSTASDYARFVQMLLNGGELGGVRLLSRKAIELMTTNHTGDLFINLVGEGWGWGLGVGVRKDLVGTPRLGSIGQYYWGGASGTHFFADPKEDLLGLQLSQVMTNYVRPNFNFEENFESLIYQALE